MPHHSKLTFVPRSSRGLSYEVKDSQTPCLIGRDPSAQICLLDRSVSRRHATLHYEAGEWILEDHSQNGSVVNGKLAKGRGSPSSMAIPCGSAPCSITL